MFCIYINHHVYQFFGTEVPVLTSLTFFRSQMFDVKLFLFLTINVQTLMYLSFNYLSTQ